MVRRENLTRNAPFLFHKDSNMPRHASRSPALHARMAWQTTVKVEREEGSENTVTV